MKNITLGQFVPGESVVHRMDPRVKMLILILFMVLIFSTVSLPAYLLLLVFLLLASGCARLGTDFFVRGLKPLLPLIAITFLFNLLFSRGTVLWSFWFFSLTDVGLKTASSMTLRLILLLLSTSLLTLTTSPIQLTDAMESLLGPFRRLGLPAHELAMMTSIALRFIPLLMEETEKIMRAQTARGAEFERGNIFQRAGSLVPLLVPLFIHAFRHAEELAVAMEARCYRGGEGRTRLRVLKVTPADLGDLLLVGFFLAFVSWVGLTSGSFLLNLPGKP